MFHFNIEQMFHCVIEKMFHCDIDDSQTRTWYLQRTFQSDISKTLESQCPKKNHVTLSEN